MNVRKSGLGEFGVFHRTPLPLLAELCETKPGIIQTEQDTREASSFSSLGEYPEVETSLRSTGGSMKGTEWMLSCHLEDCSNSHYPAETTQPCRLNSPQHIPCQSGPLQGCQYHVLTQGDVPGGRKNHEQKKHWDLRIIQVFSTHMSAGRW